MKKRLVIIVAIAAIVVVIGSMFLNSGWGPAPVLVFRGYGHSQTNSDQFAKLVFQNTLSRPAWLLIVGEFGRDKFPYNPPFLEQPLIPDTNVDRFRITEYCISDQQVLPGHDFIIHFPLVAGKPQVRVGISYYVGNFTDDKVENRLYERLNMPTLDSSAGLKERIKFLWDWSKRRIGRPKPHDVWCPQPLSFQTTNSIN